MSKEREMLFDFVVTDEDGVERPLRLEATGAVDDELRDAIVDAVIEWAVARGWTVGGSAGVVEDGQEK